MEEHCGSLIDYAKTFFQIDSNQFIQLSLDFGHLQWMIGAPFSKQESYHFYLQEDWS